MTTMQLALPKHSPDSLVQKAMKALDQIKQGTAQYRKTRKFGYRTVCLGNHERGVLIDDTLHVFHQHRMYEKFINQAH